MKKLIEIIKQLKDKETTKRMEIVCCLIVLLFLFFASYMIYNLTSYEPYPISNEVINEETTKESNQLKNE